MAKKLIGIVSIVFISLFATGCGADNSSPGATGFIEVDGKLYAPACLNDESRCATWQFAQNARLARLIGIKNELQQEELLNFWENKNGFKKSSIDPDFEFKSGKTYVFTITG